jgi:hypothetical protein
VHEPSYADLTASTVLQNGKIKYCRVSTSGGLGGSTLRYIANTVNLFDATAIVRNRKNVPSRLIDDGMNVRTADYDKFASLNDAFDGLSALNLISSASIDHEYPYNVNRSPKIPEAIFSRLMPPGPRIHCW